MPLLHTIDIPSSQPSAPCIVILHGLLGEGSNWRSIAQRIPDRFHRVMLDFVNHGASFHTDEPMSYAMMASHVNEIIQQHPLMQNGVILLGHSMGGKVAMRTALDYSDAVDALAVIDIFLQVYPSSHKDIIAGMEKIDAVGARTRGEADAILAEYEPEKHVRAFILKNLVKGEKDGLFWKCNLPCIARSYAAICSWEPVTSIYQKPCAQIYGSESPYRQPEGEQRFRHHFPTARYTRIDGAGHVVHVDRRIAFMDALTGFLNSVYPENHATE